MPLLLLCCIAAICPIPAAGEETDATLDMRIKAVQANPNEPRNYFNLGIEYYNRNMFDKATESFRKALDTNRRDKEAHAEIDLDCYQILGHIALSQNKFPEAVKWFKEGLKRSPSDPDCLFGTGQAYYNGNNYKPAREAFEKYLAAVEGNPKKDEQASQALTIIGAMAMNEKKYTDASDAFRRLIQKYPSFSGDASKNLALVLLTQGDELTKKRQYEEAVRFYDEAVQADPKNPGALRASARSHYELGTRLSGSSKAEEKKMAPGHYKVAAQNFNRAVKVDDKDFESAYFEGLSCYYLEQFDRMIDAYRKAIAINPAHAGARYNLALALYRQNSFEEARKEADESVKLAPTDPASIQLVARIHDASIEDLLRKGTEAYTAERFNDAMTAWGKVLDLDPVNPDAKQFLEQAKIRVGEAIKEHIDRGDKAYAAEDLDTALTEWSAAQALDPSNADVAAKLGKVSKVQQVAAKRRSAAAAFERGDVQVALADIEDALKISPSDKSTLSLKRRILRAQKADLTGVLTSVRKALKLGKLAQARRDAMKANEMSPNNREVADLLIRVNKRIDDTISRNLFAGREAMKAGKKTQARNAFEAVLALDSGNAEAARSIKDLTGKESAAKLSAEKVKELRKRGINAYLMGRLEEAKQAWEQVLQVDPENTEIRRYLERVKLKLKGSGTGGKTA